MAQVIMIASGKGGTGKSTVATFLATELALGGKKVFLTELDTGLRSIDIISGTSDKAVYDIGDVLMGNVSVQKAMVTSPYTQNLSIVAAPYKNQNISFNTLKKVVNDIYAEFDYIIIDTAAGIGDAFYGAIGVSNSAIIVATADTVSVRDARVVSDEIFDSGITNIKLIINKFEKSSFKYSGFADIDEIIDTTCAQLLGIVPQSSQILVSAMEGKYLKQETQEAKIFSAIKDRMQGKQQQIVLK